MAAGFRQMGDDPAPIPSAHRRATHPINPQMMIDASNETALLDDFVAFQDAVRPQWNASVGLFTGVRYVAGDDIPLSPFVGRNVTAVVSMIVFGTATAAADGDTVYLYHSGCVG